MNSPLPLVSIVIPTYNCATYLPAAIESVLQQAYPAVEVVVVDDGSTDGTCEAVEAFSDRVMYVPLPHQGAGAARNAGVCASRGEMIGFLDADDLFTPSKIAPQIDQLREDGQLDMVFGYMEEFVSPEIQERGACRLRARPGKHLSYFASSMLIRRDSFAKVGPFEPVWRVGEFVDWYLRAIDAGLRSAIIPDVVLLRRLHGDNLGIRERDARADYAHILKHALDRRRRGAQTV